jgi:hypothetical protein
VINAFHDAVEQAALLAESEEEIPAEV